jgi:hypothetical protein
VAPDPVVLEETVPPPFVRQVPQEGIGSSRKPMPILKSVLLGPSAPKEPLVSVIPSLLKEQVSNLIPCIPSPAPFRFFSKLFIDLDTPIPAYFNDTVLLIQLAFSLYPQFGDNALKKLDLQYLDSNEEAEVQTEGGLETEDEFILDLNMEVDEAQEISDDDVEVLEETLEVFLMPGRKNKPFKVREQLDDSFLRHSHRLSLKTEGFKDAKSAREASSVKSPKTSKSSSKKKAKKSSRKSTGEAEEPVPLAIIPSGGLLLPLTCPMRSYKALVKASSRYSQRVSRLHF